MITRYIRLSQHARVFRSLTGLRVAEFDELMDEMVLRFGQAEEQRLSRPGRQRGIGGGPRFELTPRNQFLLTIVWLRVSRPSTFGTGYPTHEVLGYLFGVSAITAGRYLKRCLPLLEAAGRDTMRMPDPGKKRRRQLDDLLRDTPELAVVIDTFEQRVQRPREREKANRYYSGKKKQHTLKSQVAVDENTGAVVDVAASVCGPTADLTLLKQSTLLERLPAGVGGIADLAYVGIANSHPTGLAASPRRKPRDKPRPEADVIYNRAFSKRRIVVEHSIGRMRRYQAITQPDRHHRQYHTARVVAIAGLVNLQIRSRPPVYYC